MGHPEHVSFLEESMLASLEPQGLRYLKRFGLKYVKVSFGSNDSQICTDKIDHKFDKIVNYSPVRQEIQVLEFFA